MHIPFYKNKKHEFKPSLERSNCAGKCSHFLLNFFCIPANAQVVFLFSSKSCILLYWMAATAKGLTIRKFSAWSEDVLIGWTGWMGVYLLRSVQVSATCLLGGRGRRQTPQLIRCKPGRCLNDLWPPTFNPRSVCVCLCQGHDWPALWPQRWVMCCLVWRLRINKHLPFFFFFTPCSSSYAHSVVYNVSSLYFPLVVIVLKTRKAFIKHLKMSDLNSLFIFKILIFTRSCV